MAKIPKVGTVLQVEAGVALARVAAKSATLAAAEALKAYLAGIDFVVGAGKDGLAVPFHLEAVALEWPDAEALKTLQYPSAAITTATVPHGSHAFAPTPLEDTIDVHGKGTVLWKTDELQIDFQVDFWCTDRPMREGIDAALPALFNLGEGRSGIMVQGPKEYFCQAVRLTLIEHEVVDEPESVFDGSRRLRALVRADIDNVHLRKAVPFEPHIQPVDPPL